MIVRSLAALALAFSFTASAMAATPALSPQPQGTEVAFIAQIQADLIARFPTAADAVKAGYFRYTNEDDTGAISYVNLQWTSADPAHPSQLWYDVNGNLLGADFSQPYSSTPPSLWGVNPARWTHFGAHVHYVLANGAAQTFGATRVAAVKAAGGDPQNPDAAVLVKMGKATSAAQVQHVFLFPNIWDLDVWVKTNPSGAFADKNPLVTPSAKAGSDDM
jgi:hypothetical protein